MPLVRIVGEPQFPEHPRDRQHLKGGRGRERRGGRAMLTRGWRRGTFPGGGMGMSPCKPQVQGPVTQSASVRNRTHSLHSDFTTCISGRRSPPAPAGAQLCTGPSCPLGRCAHWAPLHIAGLSRLSSGIQLEGGVSPSPSTLK